jgi:hypothetical protein
MINFSLLPFFIGVFEFLNDPVNMWGSIFVIFFSSIFVALWIQIFFVSSAQVRSLVQKQDIKNNNVVYPLNETLSRKPTIIRPQNLIEIEQNLYQNNNNYILTT